MKNKASNTEVYTSHASWMRVHQSKFPLQVLCGRKVRKENLPFPYVLYSKRAFLGFSKKPSSILTYKDVYFCSCSKKAMRIVFKKICTIEIKLRELYASERRKYVELEMDSEKRQLIEKHRIRRIVFNLEEYFPIVMARYLKGVIETTNRKLLNPTLLLSKLQFRDNLCHVCNKKIPTLEWYQARINCSQFTANYGWYEEQRIYPACFRADMKYMDFVGYRSCLPKKEKKEMKQAMNGLRVELGHPRIGEGWPRETTLFYLVKEMFPKRKITQHHRPKFLQRMELDVYIPSLKVGIEHQGQQHYVSVEHWGGVGALRKIRVRDAKKKRLCEENGVTLLYIKYNESITTKTIKEKMSAYIK